MTSIAIFAVPRARRGVLEAVARAQGELIDGAGDVAALQRLLGRRAVDVVLAEELGADELSGLVARHRATRFILLAEDSEASDLVLAGAQAVLPRDSTAAQIDAAIALTASGLRLLPDLALDRLRTLAGAEAAPPEDEAPALTPREREVLAAMADGASNKVIARRLDISFHTAKFHVASILAKLDADTRTEALARAARLGLVML
ncbi:MAG TPA: response regulator transcription factor [Stellaceae bacterium]|nr:response regulator transcription factor [Stellaceae bacterium]